MQAYSAWTYGRRNAALPRDPMEFLSGAFGPLRPIEPFAIDEPQGDSERAEPRRMQYPVGFNLPTGVPGMEGLKLASFQMLRAYADVYSVVRSCINVRKQEILGLGFDIAPTEQAEKSMRNDRAMHADFQERRMEALAWWRRPDHNYANFHSWFSAVLEEVLVVDALALYMHPTKLEGKGPFGSNLAALDLIAGDTIKPLLTLRGSSPRPPNPAFQQFVWGVPRVDLMNPILDEDSDDLGEPAATYRADQLMYLPYTTRSWTPYGFSPVEMALMPILTGLKRQQWVLDWFTEGTIPGLFVMPGPDISNAQQIRQLQDYLNAYAGDRAQAHRIVVLPGGSTVAPQKNPDLADRADEIILQNVLMPFDVMPMELGILPKVAATQLAGAGNQMAKAQQDVNKRKALKPLLMWLNRTLFDPILQEVWGQKDMRWTWEGLDPSSDVEAIAKLDQIKIASGQRSIDETRIEQGQSPWGLPETSGPILITGNVVTYLEGAIDRQRSAQQAAQNAPNDNTTDGQANSNGPGLGDGSDGPAATDGTPAHAGPSPNEEKPQATAKAKRAELQQLRAYTRHGRDIWKFKPVALSKAMIRSIATESGEYGMPLAIARAIKQVEKDAKADADLQRRQKRDAALVLIAAAVASQLGELARQMTEDQLSTLAFVDEATGVMEEGYADAYAAGADDYDTGYELDGADTQIIAARADAQHGFLQGLAQDLIAGLSPEALSARLGIYGASTTAPYAEGYVTAAQSVNPGGTIIWHTTSGDPCEFCADRDGEEYTVDTLPNWPGDGGFGGPECAGGPNCQCDLEYVESSAGGGGDGAEEDIAAVAAATSRKGRKT